MRPIIVGIEVDDKLDKITLLKELLYPINGFFKLTSVKDDLSFKNVRWIGLTIPWDEREIILMEEKERFLNESYTKVKPDCYLEFNKVADFLDYQIREMSLSVIFYGALYLHIPNIGEQYIFREVQKFECYYPQSSPSTFRGSIWHKALFPLFWISIEELYGFYDVWFYLGSWSFFDEYVPDYIEPIPKECARANFQNLYRYLEGFVERHLPYCRNCFINPDEVAINFKLAEKLKPILLQLFHGQIKDIEIIR
jgi:hypothetical protein